MTSDHDDGSLVGVRVLDCAESLGAAFCTATLERMGAEVERLHVVGPSDELQPAFLDAYLSESAVYRDYVGRAGERRRIDIAVASDVELLRVLVLAADVVVEDRREPLLRTAGIEVSGSEGRAPIVVSLTPHGRQGPRRDDLASDLTIFHGAGPGHAVPGLVEDPATMAPLRLGSHQGSFVSGLVAALNISAALLARPRTPAPITVDVSCHEALANSYRQSLGTFAYYGGGTNRDLARGRGAGGTADHHNLRCKDGYVSLVWGGVQHWDSLKGALGNPDWMEDPDLATPASRFRHWAKVTPHLEEWTAELEKEHLLYLCQGWRIPCAPVNEGPDVLIAEVLSSRAFWTTASAGDHVLQLPGLPGRPPSD